MEKLMRRIKMPLLGGVAMATIFSACTSAPRRFDPVAVSRIEKGRTTTAQLKAAFGEPTTTLPDPPGELWYYSWMTEPVKTTRPESSASAGTAKASSRTTTTSHSITLILFIDQNGVVTNYVVSEAMER